MQKKKILLWGAMPNVPKNEHYGISYKRSGNNFGNMLIGNGIVSVLDNCEYITRSQLSNPHEANERCDHIIIPAANFLWKGFDFGYMADFINATNLPVTIIGLGAQTSDRSTVSEIHPNTLRLVKIISERSPSLGVRGFYTAEVLAAHGILNVEVLGCPSLYTNLKPPKKIISPTIDSLHEVGVNFSRRVSSHAFSKSNLCVIENELLKIAIKMNLPFIAQDELEELEIAFGKGGEVVENPVASYFFESKKDDVIDYFSRNTHYFCNVNDWADFVRHRAGTIGSRLHGNIISLINDKPGFIVTHDSRTLEMVALIGAPYLHIKENEVDKFNSDYLLERVFSADYGVFISNMEKLFCKYSQFLELHKIPNKINYLNFEKSI